MTDDTFRKPLTPPSWGVPQTYAPGRKRFTEVYRPNFREVFERTYFAQPYKPTPQTSRDSLVEAVRAAGGSVSFAIHDEIVFEIPVTVQSGSAEFLQPLPPEPEGEWDV